VPRGVVEETANALARRSSAPQGRTQADAA
jgi:hypothetical protein